MDQRKCYFAGGNHKVFKFALDILKESPRLPRYVPRRNKEKIVSFSRYREIGTSFLPELEVYQ